MRRTLIRFANKEYFPKIFKLVCLIISLAWVSPGHAQQFTGFTGLGDLPGGNLFSEAWAVSADGSVIVGRATTSNGTEAFRYENGIMTGLGDLPGGSSFSLASGVSGDGSIVVGQSQSAIGGEAFRYENGVMAGLGALPGRFGQLNSNASGISADGSVIVGTTTAANGNHAFRYENGVMTGLGGLVVYGSIFGPSESSQGLGVSADGSVIVGNSINSTSGGSDAFSHANGIMTDLGIPADGITSLGLAASADGSVIVGQTIASANSVSEAFRYADGLMTGMGDLPGNIFSSRATGISADGSRIVGQGYSFNGEEAFFWEESAGMMVSIADEIMADGIDLAAMGWERLAVANAISADGTTIVGIGIHNGDVEAWSATLAAVPLPAGVWLFASALLGLFSVRKKLN